MKKIFLVFISYTCIVLSQSQNVTLDLISQFRGHGNIRTFDVEDDKLFVVSGDYLEVFDISEFGRYKKLGEYHYSMDNNSKATQIKVKGDFLFSNNGWKGLLIIDVSAMNNIRPRRSFIPSISNIAQGFTISDNIIFMKQIIGYGSSDILMADISEPLQIVEKGYYRIPFYSENISFRAKENNLYIVAKKYYEYEYQGADMIIVDISDPQNPSETYREHSGFSGLLLQDNYLMTTDTTKTLKIYDISDSHNPIIVNEIPFDHTSFSLDNNHLVTKQFSHSGLTESYKFELYNTNLMPDIKLKDSLMIVTEINKGYKKHGIFNNRLLLQKDTDISIYDISNEKFNYDKNITFPEYFYALDILVDDSLAYVSTTKSLLIFDISDLLNPILISSYAHLMSKTKLYKYKDIVYLGNRMIDVSDKFNPKLSAYLPQDGRIRDVFVINNLCYSLDNGFRIINVEDKSNPLYVKGSYFPIENGEYICVDSNYVYIVNNTRSYLNGYSSTLQIFHIEDNTIKQLGSTLISNDPTCLIISGGYAYEGFVNNDEHGINIYDVSDKSNPKLVKSHLTTDLVEGMSINEDILYVAQNYNGLNILNVSDKQNPKLIAEYNTNGRTFGVDVKGNNIYTADYNGGMYILKLNIPDVSNERPTPSKITLLQNFPNPFNNGTTIQYYLSIDSNVEVSIFNSLGSKIDILEKTKKLRGWHSFNYYPREMASGVFFLVLKTNNNSIVKKMVYLK